MPLHWKLKMLLTLAKFQKKPNLQRFTIEQARDFNNQTLQKLFILTQFSPEKLYSIENRTFDNDGYQVPIRIYRPRLTEKLPILMFFHGGGFVLNSLDSHDWQCRRIAKKADCIVISVDYRLAPEYKFPVAPQDCYAATQWAYHNASRFGGDARNIAVMGDSAGGNLATVVTLMARDKQANLPIKQQILIYPCLDGTLSFPSIEKRAEGYLLTKEIMQWFMEQYQNSEQDLKNPYFSPIFADNLHNLPPTLLITAEYDPLRDEGKEYANKLQKSGVEVVYKEYKGMIHVFFQMPKYLQATRELEKQIAQTLQKAFARKSEPVAMSSSL